MWAGSWPFGLIVAAVVLSFIAFGLVIGAPIFAVPIVVVGVAALGFADFKRRRNETQRLHSFREKAKSEKVEFTHRDKETLVSE
jgi:hypothetical protein